MPFRRLTPPEKPAPYSRSGRATGFLVVQKGGCKVKSWPEASGCLVAPLVFKTSERRAASLAGSIPVRLRHLHGLMERAHLRTGWSRLIPP